VGFRTQILKLVHHSELCAVIVFLICVAEVFSLSLVQNYVAVQ